MEKTESKTIINSKGKILFFGIDHFLKDIAKGNNCFICGAKSGSKPFNNEHIIPKWILKKFDLFSKSITLHNRAKLKYSQYKVPCCVDCNFELGKYYEKPISELLSKSYNEIIKEINNNKERVQLLFKWLCLIFLKTHLKDKTLKSEFNNKKTTEFMGDWHCWEEIHHIHCIARSHYTGAQIDNNVYGSILFLPALKEEGIGEFDYIDSQAGKGIMLQLGPLCIIAVLNDSCASLSFFTDKLRKISGPLSHFQTREIVSHLNFINLSLKERPVYYTNISGRINHKIKATLPEYFELLNKEDCYVSPGMFLKYYVEEIIGDIENKK